MKWGRLWRVLLWVQAGVNVVGALGPELAFDALWYHLPESRLAVERGWWGVIPGGLLYTSGMTRGWEYLNSLLWGVGRVMGMESPEVLVKLLSWGVGVGCALVIRRIARKYWNEETGDLAALVWYSSLVVGWQSITVYVDLPRTLLVLLSVWSWLEGKWVWSALLVGGAYSVKMLSGFDGLVLAALTSWRQGWKRGAAYLGMMGVFVGGWALLNSSQGYHPLYPFFGVEARMPANFSLRGSHLWSPLLVWFHPKFRTGPWLLILALAAGKKWWKRAPRYLLWVGVGLVLSWWFAPANTWKGDGRYLLPAAAVMSALLSGVVQSAKGMKKTLLRVMVLLVAVLGIGYRGLANSKFVPYLVGQESKGEFLAKHLNFDYGDWYDVDGWVRENLEDKRYLVVGVHNTYYLPGLRWEHESWAGMSECFPYVLMRGEGEQGGVVVHEVERTGTRIYEVGCE